MKTAETVIRGTAFVKHVKKYIEDFILNSKMFFNRDETVIFVDGDNASACENIDENEV